MAVERRLTELIGPLGGKQHTGRSRNDQVALDIRLYLRESAGVFRQAASGMPARSGGQAEEHGTVAMPGYTHLQRAQPVLFAHHLLAYVEMPERDKDRIQDATDG